MDANKTISKIEDDIVNYWAGSTLPKAYTNEQRECMAIYEREWNAVTVDDDGPTLEQDKELDKVLRKCAVEVYNLHPTVIIIKDNLELMEVSNIL